MKCKICQSDIYKIAEGESYSYYRCRKCGFYDTKNNKEDKIEIFDYDTYETFDKNIELYEEHVQQASRILNYKFNILGTKPKSFLDIGCSLGVWVEAFNNLSEGNASGIEVAELKIRYARQRGLNVGTFEDVQGKFDFVLLRHVIEHIDKPKEYLSSIMANYVARGGVLWIETPNNDNLEHRINGNKVRKDRFCRELYPPTHVCGFVPKTFKKIYGEQLVYCTTFSWTDVNWFLDGKDLKGKEKIKDLVLTYLGINGNVCAVIRNDDL